MIASACVSIVPPSSQVPPSGLQPTIAGPTQSPDALITPVATAGPTEPALHTLPPATPKKTPDPNATPDPSAGESFDVRALLNAGVTVINLSDADLTVKAAIHDPDSGEDVPVANFTIGPTQVATRSLLGSNDPATALLYKLEFSYPQGSASLGGTCVMNVLIGDDYTFVAVNQGLTIDRNGQAPSTVDETLLATSSLCVAPPATPSPPVAP